MSEEIRQGLITHTHTHTENICLLHGDCLELLKDIPDKSVDLVVTDPPYLLARDGGGGCFGSGKRTYHKEINDLRDGVTNDVLEELCRVMKTPNIYIWCSKDQLRQYIDFFEDKGCKTELITWHKTNPVPTCNNKYLSDTEYLLFFRKKTPIYGTYATKRKYYVSQTNVADKKKYHHPTIKPLNIIENLIINSSKEGDTVLDPFMGSGTTGVACKKLNRNFIGIEISEEYFKTAEDRINGLDEQIGFDDAFMKKLP